MVELELRRNQLWADRAEPEAVQLFAARRVLGM